jgi:hypothetical protein
VESIEINTSIKVSPFKSIRNRCLIRSKSWVFRTVETCCFWKGSEIMSRLMKAWIRQHSIASEKYSIPYQIKCESSFQIKYLDNQKRKKIIEILSIGELK